MLGAPARPIELEVHGTDGAASATIGVAGRHGVITPSFRRTSAGLWHSYAPFIAPEVAALPSAPRAATLVSLAAPSARPDLPLVLTRTSRGPPHG